MKFTKLAMLVLIVGMLIGAEGCSTAISRANFQGQVICSGQSADSVEKCLGQPDRVASCRYDWFWGYMWSPKSKAMDHDHWVTISTAEVIGGNISEWVFFDRFSPESLVLWLKSGTVDRMWLTGSK